ncbi:hypothetical protein COLO4_22661 [Corchorus olitorius]|uniref:Uncharacterized protein n=1 Tax=Corchorus olitorius TaxID=93759 RepID=A0A1R3IKV4_9ROSI|nr:hypothetical protein COLO4_22661 [Corchorus olitorius]
MEEDAVGDPPSKGERSGVKRGRTSLEQDAMGEDFPPLTGVPKPNQTAKQQEEEAAPEANIIVQSSAKEGEKNSGFGPWMVVKKPPRKAPSNKQTYEKGNPAVPAASQAGSRFAVLNNIDDSQDSDEVVPNTIETNVTVAANKSGNDMRLKGDSRKQFQQNLQHVAQLANKGGVGGSSSDNAKSKHGPKFVVSDSANMSPAMNIPNKNFASKHAAINPLKKKNLEPSDGSWCSDPDTLKQMVVNYFRELYSENDVDLRISLPSLCEDWKLNHNEKLSLEVEVTVEEVRAALFGMSPNKSPGIEWISSRLFSENMECNR